MAKTDEKPTRAPRRRRPAPPVETPAAIVQDETPPPAPPPPGYVASATRTAQDVLSDYRDGLLNAITAALQLQELGIMADDADLPTELQELMATETTDQLAQLDQEIRNERDATAPPLESLPLVGVTPGYMQPKPASAHGDLHGAVENLLAAIDAYAGMSGSWDDIIATSGELAALIHGR